VKQFLWS